MSEGDLVQYDKLFNEQEGKYQAENVTSGTGGKGGKGGGTKGKGGYGGNFGYRSSGTVKFFNNSKGFGFIIPDDGSDEIFVNANYLSGCEALSERDLVQYDKLFNEQKGEYQAENVTSRYRSGKGGKGCKGGKGGGYPSSGTVKFFNDSKGYGFIVPDDGSEDLFVHANYLSGCTHWPCEGDLVQYDKKFGERKGKYQAENVTVTRLSPDSLSYRRLISSMIIGKGGKGGE